MGTHPYLWYRLNSYEYWCNVYNIDFNFKEKFHSDKYIQNNFDTLSTSEIIFNLIKICNETN